MEKLLKELSGFSGSRIFLMQNDSEYFVRKIGNVSRNIERMSVLSNIINLPHIYQVNKDSIDMQYVSGLDMKTYLLHQRIEPLIEFLIDTIYKLTYNAEMKCYSKVYESKLSGIDFSAFPFSRDELIDFLPSHLPQSMYHGDFTLDNILFNEQEDRFYMIDPLTTEYDSYVFDLAKLNQDLSCGWFVRNADINLASKLLTISDAIKDAFAFR